jgi:hypothetical protein
MTQRPSACKTCIKRMKIKNSYRFIFLKPWLFGWQNTTCITFVTWCLSGIFYIVSTRSQSARLKTNDNLRSMSNKQYRIRKKSEAKPTCHSYWKKRCFASSCWHQITCYKPTTVLKRSDQVQSWNSVTSTAKTRAHPNTFVISNYILLINIISVQIVHCKL